MRLAIYNTLVVYKSLYYSTFSIICNHISNSLMHFDRRWSPFSSSTAKISSYPNTLSINTSIIFTNILCETIVYSTYSHLSHYLVFPHNTIFSITKLSINPLFQSLQQNKQLLQPLPSTFRQPPLSGPTRPTVSDILSEPPTHRLLGAYRRNLLYLSKPSGTKAFSS